MDNTIIIGCGISGLNLADKLKTKYKTSNISIYDKNDYIGGRVRTVKEKNDYIDSGAARFSKNNKNLYGLIKRFNLEDKVIEIPSGWESKTSKKYDIDEKYNSIDKLLDYLIKLSKSKSKTYLQSISLAEFCKKELGKKYLDFLEDNHPYYSELNILNCVQAVKMFSEDLSEKQTFYILKGGLSQITNNLANCFKKNKGNIYLNHQLEKIEYDDSKKIFTVYFDNLGKKAEKQCKKLICAMDANSLKNIEFLHKNIKELDSVKTQPLLRLYQKFPTKDNKSWFSGLGKIVTPFSENKLKFFIPVNSQTGLVMTSYTDGKYTDFWYKHVIDGTVEETLLKEARKLFKDIKIPKPIYTNIYYWLHGASYWKKGVDANKIYKKMIKPLNKELYICGDSYSLRQAWQEGALETSNLVFNKITLIKTNKTKKKKFNHKLKHKLKHKGGKNVEKKTNKKKLITLKELAKHNKANDAWIGIRGSVYDVSNWFGKHPGGAQALLGNIGKDSTDIFNKINAHKGSQMVKKMLKGIGPEVIKIGKLKK